MPRSFRIGPGGRVDTARPLAFTFDGRRYQCCLGDTLASALLANGVHLVARSFKYHRPRGILSAGSEEPNGLVTVDRGGGRETPNLRATQVEVYDGLVARSQNRWPSLRFDLAATSDALSPLFGAGFYYKTFMGPRPFNAMKAWAKVYEPLIRRAAGLGRAPSAADPDGYANRFAHCDVLVIGAGPAGLAAALAAAECGARVILCDEQSEMGGSLLAETEAAIDGQPAQRWGHETVAALARNERVTLLRRTTAFGAFAQGFVALAERLSDHRGEVDPERPRERLWQVRAREIVLAAGAIERPLVFPGNDRPGIMLADAARTYAARYRVRPGMRAVVLTACDSAYQAAIALRQAGVDIALLADIRETVTGPWPDAARASGLPIETATVITATGGRARVRHVMTGQVASNGRVRQGGAVEADLVLMSGGWTPTVHLLSQARGRLSWSETLKAYVPADGEQPMRVVGGARGTLDLKAALDEGYAAGAAVAKATGARGSLVRSHQVTGTRPTSGAHVGLVPHLGERIPAKAFVDFQNDVTTKDLKLAAREGFRSIEHVKRYTTTGMATDQGKTSNLNAIAIVAGATGLPPPEVGLTTYRQPYTPVTFGTLAGLSRGSLFDPIRTTPTHAWAIENGAVFEDVGQWKRARYFPKAGEDMHAAVKRECRVVRARCGLFDASTLGKIEVVGPDAGEFLERMYVNTVKSLPVGRCRYALMLNEAGFVIDDGIIGRLAPDRFHVTTTTGGAARVLNQMEDYLQTEWPDLKVWLTSVTEHWAVIALQGPLARAILSRHVEGTDLAGDALPHMGVTTAAKVAGVAARLFRVSFTGEAGYEINVPASEGLRLWETLWGDVAAAEGVAYGTETMHVLRAEKGFIIVGQETDGTVTPEDVGLYPAAARKKRDFVGKRSLARSDMVAAGRKQLVGLLTERLDIVLEEGAQVTAVANPATGMAALGHVTSSYWSEAVGRSIALGLVANGRARFGERLYVPMPEGAIAVTVAAPVFYDEKGARLSGDRETPSAAFQERPSAASLGSRRPDPASMHVPAERVRLAAALTGAERWILRGSAEVATRAGAALGIALPLEPCRAGTQDERAALWLGPDEWLLLALPGDTTLARLGEQLAGLPHALVDVTDRQLGYALEGPDVAALLSAGCPLDLHPAAFPVGMATRTLLAKAEIVLWRTAPGRFHIEVGRSFAPYVEGFLAEASRGLG